jgi:excisionase family DNA binding protein
MNDIFQQQIADALDGAADRKHAASSEAQVPETAQVPPELQDRLMTVPETAEFLSISKSMVYKLVETGCIPAYHIGRLIRIRQSDLIDSLAAFAIA